MRVEYHPLTVADLNNAVTYYEQQRSRLGGELRFEIYATIERIRENPSQYPIVEHGVRRCLVHRFPYSVLFRIVANDVLRVLVIRHHHRHPSTGLDRR